jgi:hypothetical protein
MFWEWQDDDSVCSQWRIFQLRALKLSDYAAEMLDPLVSYDVNSLFIYS